MKNLAGNKYKILERKSSQFGRVGIVDRQSDLEKPWQGKPLAYYNNINRKDAYKTCRDRYLHDQLARPIINTIVNAVFSKPPDFQGDEKLTKRARQIVRDSEINWTMWGIDLEVFGDIFLRAFFGDNAKLASIPPESMDIKYDQKNVLDIQGFTQFKDELGVEGKPISTEEMIHAKINSTTDVIYGSSTLRQALWWFDVLDNLWERNCIRSAQYYGSPVVAITGVPGEHIVAVQTALQQDGQRPGRNWVFPPDTKVDTLDFTKGYPMHELIDRVYQYILAAVGIPQHLIYESDSSRGVAMFSADGFEMMIKARRRTWELAIIRAMKLIFKDEGIWKDDADFHINWAPVFLRDLKNIASMLDTAVTNGIISKQGAREFIGFDHSIEKERIDKERDEEPQDMVSTTAPDGKTTTVSGKVARTPPTKVGK